ncbi:MAG: patatin-like phospholipase domain-containing protein [Desulfobacterales bacterium]|nr:patatin-like phospholipase domain-containing protein [Desulfobacterales bacterium]
MDLESFLTTVPLFSSISNNEIHEISACFQTVYYKKGQIIFDQGDESDAMYIIRSGTVCIRAAHQERNGAEIELTRGNFFGEMALISDLQRNATAIVSLDTVLYRLKKADFETLINKNKQIGLFLSRLYARRLSSGLNLPKGPLKPSLFAVSATHAHLGSSHFLYSTSYHIATESTKKLLVVDPKNDNAHLTTHFELTAIPPPDQGIHRMLTSQLCKSDDICWYSHPSGFEVLHIHQHSKEKIQTILPQFMERIKRQYNLIFFNMDHRFLEFEKQVIRLCDKNLLIIQNTHDELQNVKSQIDFLEEISGIGLDKVRVGVSHLAGDKGIPRERLKQVLNLSETPQIWIEKTEKSRTGKIDTQKRFPIKGARAIARELAGVRVGLALGAGAARGWAHIGVLKILQEQGIHIDMIAGTSMGALVGAVFAAHGSIDHLVAQTIQNLSSKMKARRTIYDYTLPLQGLLRGVKVMNLVRDAINHADFMDLVIPTYIVGVDILKGEEILFETGDVAQAVRSSLSLPGIFVPHKYRNRWMVDGGLLNPVPVNILEQKGADKIIAVCVENPHSSNPKDNGSPSIMKVIMRTINIVHGHATRGFAEKSDIVIYPETKEFAWDDFHRGTILMERGEKACIQMLDEIKKLHDYAPPDHFLET